MTKQRFYQQIALVLAGAMGLALIWEHALAGVISTWLWPAHASDGGIASWLDVIAFTAICGLALTALVILSNPTLAARSWKKAIWCGPGRCWIPQWKVSPTGSSISMPRTNLCSATGLIAMPTRLAAHMLTPGSDFTLIVRHLVDHGFYGNSEAEKASMIRTRMERHRSGNDFEYRMEDGRWFHMSQFKT